MDWDEYFMSLARLTSLRSKDRSTKVGCVIVGPDNEIRTTGYNGFPRGIVDDAPERHERPEKYLWTEHAERNAIYNAARCGVPLKGCRVYLPWFPCMDCARAIVQSGVTELIAFKPNTSDQKWGAEFERALTLFSEAGVAVRFMEAT
jgi:dCMP deaminase